MHEIIHVVDSESRAQMRCRNLEIEVVDDHPLAAGYYFVLWPSQGRKPGNRGKRYLGPLPTLIQARMLQRSALALGLVEDDMVIRPVAECRTIVRCSVTSSSVAGAYNYFHSRHEATGHAAP